MTKNKRSFFKRGIRFKCLGCGACCNNRGDYAFVFVTIDERRRMARYLQMPTSVFTRRYCKKAAVYSYLRDAGSHCVFRIGGRCRVYRARPEQCRTWPFWPENMNTETWYNEVMAACPGAGKGKRHSCRIIENYLRRAAYPLK
jgi:Fe-S-cluster containining protein